MSGWTVDEMPRLDGMTVVVTGANSGLGYEGTRAFAEKGATVVMACRSVERGERAADEIRRESAVARTDLALDVRECDLASLDSVREFAEGLAADYDAVDVLCNNAGVMAIPRRETEDGFETQFGVNHLGHFALTGRLFPLLKNAEGIGGDARVVTQSSGAHEQGEMDFSDLNWEESYGKWRAYGRSKLANLLFAYELQRRIGDAEVSDDADASDGAGATDDLDVRSVACHPGYAATNLQHRTAEESGNPLLKIGMTAANAALGQDAATGALPMLYAATADVDGGAYVEPSGFMNMRGTPAVGRSNDASYDRADARRLWEYSEEATGVEFPI
jgi:NAD(P)-dependent dehydrogenase (short-subunit alcohol dehydrogenase family)